MTQRFEPSLELSLSDLGKVMNDPIVREIIKGCSLDSSPADCIKGPLLDRVIEMFAPAPASQPLLTMEKWVETGDPSADSCRPCALPVTLQWYAEELEKNGLSDLSAQIKDIGLTADPLTLAREMDRVKATVEPGLRSRLLDFDQAIQVNVD